MLQILLVTGTARVLAANNATTDWVLPFHSLQACIMLHTSEHAKATLVKSMFPSAPSSAQTLRQTPKVHSTLANPLL